MVGVSPGGPGKGPKKIENFFERMFLGGYVAGEGESKNGTF